LCISGAGRSNVPDVTVLLFRVAASERSTSQPFANAVRAIVALRERRSLASAA
jgi:hypothetical protein